MRMSISTATVFSIMATASTGFSRRIWGLPRRVMRASQ